MAGALAAVWLVVAGIVVIRVDAERAEAALSRTTAETQGEIRPVVVQPLATDSHTSETLTESRAELTVEESLVSATDEPLAEELTAFFLFMQDELSHPEAQIPAELSAYVGELVARINSSGELFVVRLYDPSLQVARRQAVRGHALLVEAGLQLWLLEPYGERGPATVTVSRG